MFICLCTDEQLQNHYKMCLGHEGCDMRVPKEISFLFIEKKYEKPANFHDFVQVDAPKKKDTLLDFPKAL